MKKSSSLIRLLLVFSVLFICHSAIKAQQTDIVYQNKIVEYTTDSVFLPSSVTTITKQPGIPSPLEYFGSIIGAPGVMHHTYEIYGYFRKLAEASSKLTMEQLGTSEEGRSMNLITIGDAKTIKKLDTYKKDMALIADPRKTSEAAANKLIGRTKVVYYLNGGMHSTEMGSPEMLMELAYRLITDESDEIKNILDNCIVIINPVSEPDGRDKQVDWYYRYTKDRKEFDDGFSKSPPYWGKYVFHDNNRDGFQVSQEISKAIAKAYFEWHPTIMLDLHESIPLLYISTGTGPYNKNIDPITIGEWQTIANSEMTSLSAQGLPGVFDWAFYDGWWSGYGIWIANTHNSIGRFYETFGNAGANTYLRDISKAKFAGDLVTSREWYRPAPSTGKLYWSSRNNINYTEAAVLSSLKYAADNRKTLLKNFYQKGVNSTSFYKTNDIKMFVVPAEQRDPVMVAYLVNQLRKQHIEIYKTKETNEYVIPLNQPYSRVAFDFLTKQEYPKEAKFPPYDAIAWTLGLMYGVDVHELDSMKYNNAEMELVDNDVVYKGQAKGTGSDYIIDYKAQSSIISGLYDLQKTGNLNVQVVDSMFIENGDTIKQGAIVLEDLDKNRTDKLAADFGIDLQAKNLKLKNSHKVSLPKIAVFHSWDDTQDEGWVRFTLEQKGIPYTSIDKDDLKKGALKKQFDIIIIPQQYGNLSDFVNGVDDRFGPIAYTKTAEFPSHGYPDSSQDITGGPGWDGLNNLSQFVKDGGVLVPLDNSASIIADAGIGKQAKSFSPGNLFHPGSIVTVKARNSKSPILYGYPEIFHVFKGNGRLLRTEKYDRNLMILQYGTKPLKDELEYKGKILGAKKEPKAKEKPAAKDSADVKNKKEPDYVLSGMVRNENEIIGNAVILNVPVGKGRVVFFTFNPLNRYLNHYDSSLLWNVLINWDHL